MGLFGFSKKKKEEKALLLEQQRAHGRALFEEGKKAYSEGKHEDAEKLLLQACVTCVDAVLYLGNLYCNEFNDKDEADAFELYEKYEGNVFKDSSYAIIMRERAECYLKGKGTPKNRLLAVKTMKSYKGFEENLNEIEYHKFIGDCYVDLWNDIVKIRDLKDNDFHEYLAMQYDRENEMPDAFKLIDNKKYNKSFKTDYGWIRADTLRKGLNHYESAAEMGDMFAAYASARLLISEDWKSDDEPVQKYLKIADDAGYYPAAADLFWYSVRYESVYVDKDIMEDIVKRLKRGANHCSADCQFALAMCYAPNYLRDFMNVDCNPLQPNPEKFIHLLETAEKNGCKEAAVYWAEYLAFGEIWMENIPERKTGLLYKNEQIRRNPLLASATIMDAIISLEEKINDPIDRKMRCGIARTLYDRARYIKKLISKAVDDRIFGSFDFDKALHEKIKRQFGE